MGSSENTAADDVQAIETDETLKYHLLGPSLTKAGQGNVDQQKVGYLGDDYP